MSPVEVIRVRGARRSFPMDGWTVHALRGLDLTITQGEFVALMGSSGSGKSTLLNILGCLDRLDKGEYWLEGQNVGTLNADRRAELRSRRVGFVFQSFNLLPRMSAWENVALPLAYRRDSGNDRNRAVTMLERVGLARRATHFPAQLSGGERQRVAIARALIADPAILLADEPTGNLDSATGTEIIELLTALNGQGCTILMVTHDPRVAEAAQRRIVMKDGQILSEEQRHDSL
jgi:putative ABC transport system ATP-binding protein